MKLEILPSLTANLENALYIVDTIMLRSNQGNDFTISIGETLLPTMTNKFGAKVMLLGNPDMQIGVCEGSSIEEVFRAAQELIGSSIANPNQTSAVPKPFIAQKTQVTA